MSPSNSAGYLGVNLRVDGQVKRRLVHVLVLEAFVGPRPSRQHESRHLNDRKRDNRPTNLAWGLHSDNEADKQRNGRVPRGVSCGTSKLSEDDVAEIRHRRCDMGEKLKPTAEDFNISVSNVSEIARNTTWRHLLRASK